jgi:hypothetical protein
LKPRPSFLSKGHLETGAFMDDKRGNGAVVGLLAADQGDENHIIPAGNP